MVEAISSGETQATISRALRAEKGSPGWDGKAKNDKEYRMFWQKVHNAVKSMASSGLDSSLIHTKQKYERTKILKRKHCSMEDSRRKRPKEVSEQSKMDN